MLATQLAAWAARRPLSVCTSALSSSRVMGRPIQGMWGRSSGAPTSPLNARPFECGNSLSQPTTSASGSPAACTSWAGNFCPPKPGPRASCLARWTVRTISTANPSPSSRLTATAAPLSMSIFSTMGNPAGLFSIGCFGASST